MSLLDTTDQGNDQPQIDESKNYVEELVGDGKKFKSVEDLAKGKAYADAMIEIQNKRMDELRQEYLRTQEELKSRTSMQQMMDQLSDKLSTRENTLNTEDERKPVFDPSQIDGLIDQRLTHYEQQRKATANQNEVKGKLMERYGNNYGKVLEQQLNDLGMSASEMDALAQRSPKAFYRMFGLDATNNTNQYEPPIRSQQRGEWSPTQPKRTYSYYQEMLRKNPTEYFSAKTHNQMLQDMDQLGDSFKDGTWRDTEY